jgi:hypothetical protein
MPSSDGFVQAYNGQLAVDCDSMLIAGCQVAQSPIDSRQLPTMLRALCDLPIGKPTALLADALANSMSSGALPPTSRRILRSTVKSTIGV